MPNGHFSYTDKEPPIIKAPFYFFKNNSKTMIQPDDAGNTVLSGKVDIVVGMREAGLYSRSNENGFGDRLGVARIEYEIVPLSGAQGQVQRFRSFDFGRIKIKKGYDARQYGTELTRVVYKHWKLFQSKRPHGSQTFSYYIITNCSGTKQPEELGLSDRNHCWDTAGSDDGGNPLFPNGRYDITVSAYDFSGNVSKKTMKVTLANGIHGKSVPKAR